jgi:hypothetical protein
MLLVRFIIGKSKNIMMDSLEIKNYLLFNQQDILVSSI